MDRDALAEFLRARRQALAPADVGLTAGPRRRTAGLRREEIAQLTGMSVDYYTRLEQRRGPQPSTQMLAALARTLRLRLDERDHLYRLAGHPAPERTASSPYVRPALIHVLDQLDDCAAFVCSDLEVFLAQNRLSVLLMGDHVGSGARDSMVWKWFLGTGYRELFPAEELEHHARIRVAALRAAWSRRRGDADVQALVDGLLSRSEEFRRLWDRHEVGIPPDDHKTFVHPKVGRISVDCEILATADGNQRLVILSAPPASEAYNKLKLLSVLGDQEVGA
ncbi:helix-turn-helix transcriptional regulator [Mycobacterium sp.]|uniref:helix-turn-helix transcriptional regulator n=1 Tax=Mycobacterium sp. TaxID=1785 RepID=UPI002D2B2313|nr:helix-turn-helix transcriptional regulator [Mycobacterium sp.]HZA10221.1 helix-turn-helix transcriptional regulator [Mycobacterium sp.]